MIITEQHAQQFLDAINDYLSDGHIGIDAISEDDARNLSRKEMDKFLLSLMRKVLEISK
jgi:hypothetical protein